MENKIHELEEKILNCFINEPSLLETTKLKDEDFHKEKRTFVFFKKFYAQYKNLDLDMMLALTKNKMRLATTMTYLNLIEPTSTRFKEYEDLLIMLNNESEIEKDKINKTYELACELVVRKINSDEFLEKITDYYTRIGSVS